MGMNEGANGERAAGGFFPFPEHVFVDFQFDLIAAITAIAKYFVPSRQLCAQSIKPEPYPTCSLRNGPVVAIHQWPHAQGGS